MWLVKDDQENLLEGIRKAAEALKSAENKSMTCEDDEVEVNSGVECPSSKSLEPFVGSTLTVGD
jgi:hypothetical protein